MQSGFAEFLAAFGETHTFQLFPDDSDDPDRPPARILHGTIEQHLGALVDANMHGAGVFFTVQQTDGRGRRNENITAARALYIDLDGYEGDPAPVWHLPPSFIVQTSAPHKMHAYWLLEPGERLDRVKPALEELARSYSSDPKVTDLPRVLRVPGFWHTKREPVLSQIVEAHPDRRYTIDDVLAGLTQPVDSGVVDFVLFKLHRCLQRLRYVSEGERNNEIYRAAFLTKDWVRDGTLPEELLIDTLTTAAAQLPGTPMPRREIEATVRSAIKTEVVSHAYQALLDDTPAETAGNLALLPNVGDVGEGVIYGIEDADIGEHILRDLGSGLGHVKAVSGALWTYSDGLWTEIPPDQLRSQIQEYHGRMLISEDGTKKRLNVTARRRDGIIDLMLHHPDVLDSRWFDATSPGVLFANGLVSPDIYGDFETHPAEPEHRCRVRVDVAWDRRAECPNWDRFLLEIFSGDHAMVSLLQEFVGGALLGVASQYAKALVLHGSGSNGKGVLLTALDGLLFPKGAVSYVSPSLWGREYYLYALRNSLLNLVGELPEGRLHNTDIFKSVVAGDAVLGRPPYGQPIQFRPRAAHIFSCNSLPATKDYTHGFWRRFLVLPMDRQFSGEVRSVEILAGFLPERSGVVRWAMEGGVRLLQQRGYSSTERQKAAEHQWRLEADPVAAFLSTCTATGGTTGSTELYGKFRMWCDSTGRMAPSAAKLGRRLREAQVPCRRTKAGIMYAVTVLPQTEWPLIAD